MKPIIEPHIHMIARTTDDYMAMRANGIRVCVEPSFWLGENRRYAGSFFDYFRLSLEFEHTRAARYGIDHWSAIGMNPKEAENRKLADEVIDGLCLAQVQVIALHHALAHLVNARIGMLGRVELVLHPADLHTAHLQILGGGDNFIPGPIWAP